MFFVDRGLRKRGRMIVLVCWLLTGSVGLAVDVDHGLVVE